MNPCKPDKDGSCQPRVFRFDPLDDQRWEALAQEHPQATVFHSAPWLRTLREAYGYRPLAWSTSPPGRPLEDAAAACLVESLWTGKRLVSLPFSDHCDPLAADPRIRDLLVNRLEQSAARRRLRYCEVRLSSREAAQAPDSPPSSDSPPPAPPPSSAGGPDKAPGQEASAPSYCWHYLDLTPGAEPLYANLHPSCVRAKVRRARREGLRMRQGGIELLDDFYRLLIETRRRHGLPPQPRRWFRLLARHMGDRMSIHMAFHGAEPAAALLLLRHGSTLIYKYGCSRADKHALGGMPFLFWETIRQACTEGLTLFDLGRSDWDQKGLLDFKDRLGARRGRIQHRLWPAQAARPSSGPLSAVAQRAFSHLPDPLLMWAGRLLYPHMG